MLQGLNWKTSSVVFIPKTDKSDAKSYRPSSLLSVTIKILERYIQNTPYSCIIALILWMYASISCTLFQAFQTNCTWVRKSALVISPSRHRNASGWQASRHLVRLKEFTVQNQHNTSFQSCKPDTFFPDLMSICCQPGKECAVTACTLMIFYWHKGGYS